MCADVVICTDSSSGLPVVSPRELGRLKHVQTRHLWVQQRVQEGRLTHEEGESGDTNVSDALTKPLDEERMLNLRVQRRTDIVGARGVTIDIVLNGVAFSAARLFEASRELRSGILERN